MVTGLRPNSVSWPTSYSCSSTSFSLNGVMHSNDVGFNEILDTKRSACFDLNHGATNDDFVIDNRLAAATFKAAQVGEVFELIVGDAREYLRSLQEISFCFLDSEKEVCSEFYEMVVPNLTSGGLHVADNAVGHGEILEPFFERALSDERIDAMVRPMGKGLLMCRKQ